MKGARKRLRACEDFREEQSALGNLLADRSHVLLMSLKAHPEVAGKGIEYFWGKAKREFHPLNNCDAKHLHANVLAANTSTSNKYDASRERRGSI